MELPPTYRNATIHPLPLPHLVKVGKLVLLRAIVNLSEINTRVSTTSVATGVQHWRWGVISDKSKLLGLQ